MNKVLLKELLNELLDNNSVKTNDLPYEVGEAYFFRTVTYHTVAKVKKVIGNFLVLEEASWIADSGRFGEFINDGKVYESTSSEVEPLEVDVILNTNSIVDSFPWKHKMPNKVK